LTRYRASWLVPIAGRPIRNGWVAIDGGLITALGGPDDGCPAEDLGSVAILPGLVNAHVHLELSHLRGLVPPADHFVTWIRNLVALRRGESAARDAEIVAGIAVGVAEAVRFGTALVGDISNTLLPFAVLAQSDLAAIVFYELIQFKAPDAERFVGEACARIGRLAGNERLRASLAAHAPYSVAPSVFRAIRRAVDSKLVGPVSVHLSESREETEFIRTGDGAWRSFLQELGAWDPAWTPPAVSPVEFLDNSDFLDARVMAVHGVQMTSSDLARLARRGVTLVACPRSNAFTGAGRPPIADFYASGVSVAVGTDSLACTADLNLFAELAAMRALAPDVAAARLLDSATRQGARALGFEADYGTIAPGRRARLLAVAIPDGIDDVEEYLVGGVRAEQIRWLPA
jgi:cytosine/adenosine deaminase-related metal-dependent hydrolase